jgi:hypothetical protein
MIAFVTSTLFYVLFVNFSGMIQLLVVMKPTTAPRKTSPSTSSQSSNQMLKGPCSMPTAAVAVLLTQRCYSLRQPEGPAPLPAHQLGLWSCYCQGRRLLPLLLLLLLLLLMMMIMVLAAMVTAALMIVMVMVMMMKGIMMMVSAPLKGHRALHQAQQQLQLHLPEAAVAPLAAVAAVLVKVLLLVSPTGGYS